MLFLLMASLARGSDSISTDDFRKFSLDEQSSLIEKAPPEMKEKLSQIYRNELLTVKYGGEEGLKKHQEDRMIEARGLGEFIFFFLTQEDLFAQYRGVISDTDGQAGMPHTKQLVIEKALQMEQDAIQKRYEQVIHPLLVGLAPSPQALELAKNAKAYADKLRERYMLNETVTPPKPRIRKTEMDQVDKFTDQLVQELNGLPQLPQAQVVTEINALPEEPLQR